MDWEVTGNISVKCGHDTGYRQDLCVTFTQEGNKQGDVYSTQPDNSGAAACGRLSHLRYILYLHSSIYCRWMWPFWDHIHIFSYCPPGYISFVLLNIKSWTMTISFSFSFPTYPSRLPCDRGSGGSTSRLGTVWPCLCSRPDEYANVMHTRHLTPTCR